MNDIQIKDSVLAAAAAGGYDDFLEAVASAVRAAVGGELNAESMQQLNAGQITLWAYLIVRDEVMNGGFVGLIHNGYGPFIFLNPFAKAMRLWGLRDFSKLIYKGRKLYEEKRAEIERDCTDEAFMALFEQHPEFDDLDDEFVESEEEWTAAVARYVDAHLETFIRVEND